MPDTLSSPHPDLTQIPMETVPGVGPQILKKLHKLGIRSVADALYTLPLRYEDRSRLYPLQAIRPGQQAFFKAQILTREETFNPRTRKGIYQVRVGDREPGLILKWYHYRRPWMEKEFVVGRHLLVYGAVKAFSGTLQIEHPDVTFINNESGLEDNSSSETSAMIGILPVYPLTAGLTQKTARKIWRKVIDRYAPAVKSPLPAEMVKRLGMLPLAEAFRRIHCPDDKESLANLDGRHHPARVSIAFDEFFFLELGLALKKRGGEQEQGRSFEVTHRYTKPLAKRLPYRLTAAQKRVLGEIKNDMMAPSPMNRLLQGDVGSGKTIVALMAALIAIENETQATVLAPTEVLAEQHFLQFHRYLEELGLHAALLTASATKKEREQILSRLRDGGLQLLVGTHAILEKEVAFKDLGLVIIDEQHRFGVLQRGLLRTKGKCPDILVMTATPIPRTLCLTLYGNLTLSVIDELPPGRAPVKTTVLDERRRSEAYRFMAAELAAGRQAFVVYPVIEESENSGLQSAEQNIKFLQDHIFPQFRVGLLHGRLKPEEKEQAMKRFRDHDLDILAATTVIEVGIDIPNATVMMVENAERFGLAQLHQLRGRVGRGSQEGHCLLIRSEGCGAEGRKRLQVMAETTDGFRIAEADMRLRGPGEFLGTRQHGEVDFRVADLLHQGGLLEMAREEAFRIVEREDFLTSAAWAEMRDTLHRRWGQRLELASIG